VFNLGELFVSFTGKDSGLAKVMKLAESSGNNLTKVFNSAMKEGGKIGVAGAKAFGQFASGATKAGAQSIKSFERITVAGLMAFSRLTPAGLKFFDRMADKATKLGLAGMKSFTTLGTAAIKSMASKGGGDKSGALAGLYGMIGIAGKGMGMAVSGGFKMIATAAQMAWASATMGLSILVTLGAAVVGLGGYATGMAGNFQEVKGKFDTVFGESAPAATLEIDKMARAMGRSKAQLTEMAANTQDLLVPLGFARDKAAGMSVQIAQLAVDMASFGNKSDADAINDIQAAMTGSGEVMKKYGVVLSENTLKLELERMGHKGSAESANEQMKALARLNIIVRGTSDAHGDAVKTGGSFGNQMKRIMALVQDLGIKIGSIFMPAAEVFLQFFGDAIGEVDAASVGVESWGQTLKGVAENVTTVLRMVMAVFSNWAELSGLVYNLIDAGLGDVEDAIVSFGNDAWAIFSALGNNMLEFFPNVLDSIAKSHGSLWEFLNKGWAEIWDFIRSGGTDAIEIGIDEVIKDVWKKVKAPIMPSATTHDKSVKAWEELVGAIDAKMQKAGKKVDELKAIKEFDKSLAGEGKETRKIKFELVSASSLFTKNLEMAFGDKEGEKLEIAKRGVEVAEKNLVATEKVVAAVEKEKKSAPLIGA